jgi:hypothetical protein
MESSGESQLKTQAWNVIPFHAGGAYHLCVLSPGHRVYAACEGATRCQSKGCSSQELI